MTLPGFGIVWRYRVDAAHRPDFERAYAPGGDWAELFGRSDGYRGTELIRAERPGEYLTVDRWVTEEAFDAFMEEWGDEYAGLDRRLEPLAFSQHLVVRGPLVGAGTSGGDR